MPKGKKRGPSKNAMEMAISLRGRIRNCSLPATRALLPLHEALVNSLHSLEAARRERPEIQITLIRDGQQSLVPELPDSLPPITAFCVEDNGVGFTDENFESFRTSDSVYKMQKGGKGVGRFNWLVAFEDVRISSVYEAGSGERRKRQFRFSLDGITEHEDSEASPSAAFATQVKIQGFKDPWRLRCPKRLETIGIRTLEHVMSWFVFGIAPRIVFRDGQDALDLEDLWRDSFAGQTQRQSFDLKGERFEIDHIRYYNPRADDTHTLHLCANGREVKSSPLQEVVPPLPRTLTDSNGTYYWKTFVSSRYLDRNVSENRTRFLLPETKPEARSMFEEEEAEISIPEVKDEVASRLRELLKDEIASSTDAALRRVERYVDETAPQYKLLLKYAREPLANLSPELTERELENELHRLRYLFERQHRQHRERILKAHGVESSEYEKFITEQNDLGIADLARYVHHRKVIIELLERALQTDDTDKYRRESVVHNLIFPMRASSDEIDFDSQNLWLIDDRLTYHYYLASDREFKKQDINNIQDEDRPDLLIYNRNFALTEGPQDGFISSVVIIEFKRPMRADYHDEDDNPFNQVYRYAGNKIRRGGAKTRKGRPITIPENILIYCYIIADLTPQLHERCRFHSFTPSPHGDGYYNFNPSLQTYTEVISYDKLLSDAKKRNRAFFDKLRL